MNNSSPIRHLLIIEDQNNRRTIPLEEMRYSIGRHSSNSITISSSQASRKHATLVRKMDSKNQNYSFWILDGDLEGNKSHNGIFVNGIKCLVHELKNGDLINFGCNVNASYHFIANASETSFEREVINNNKVKNLFPLSPASSPQLQKTLLLSDSSPESSIDKETYHEQSYYDSLTNLPTRTLFNEHLSIALTNAKRTQSQMAILMLDLEGLRNINDKFGYAIGDQLLQSVAQRLKDCLRGGDIVARWGGDEFTILLPQITNVENINRISQRILKSLQKPFEIHKYQIQINSSVGISIYPQDGQDSKTFLKKAEFALELHKKQAQNTVRLDDSTSNNKNSQLLRLEKLLHQALEKEEFSLYYQPQVNIKTGEIDGMEALLRWQHPELGLMSPRKFIPWIEKTDLIAPFSKWILKTACSQNQLWQKAGLSPLSIAVNLSSGQFQQPNLVKMVAQVLSETGLDPHCLELEITEATLMQDLEFSRKALHNLQQMGVRISMDDFGTGYSSLGYLRQFSFHKLKIDQSCVNNLKDNPKDTAIISAVIALGHSFKVRVVAEGVETQQQLELLRSLQCEEMQGYRFSLPLKAEEATKFLSCHRAVVA